MNESTQGDRRSPEPVLDASVIEMLRELGGPDEPELLEDLVEIFLDDAPARIRDIEEALAEANYELMERAAHTLKSSAANLGAMVLSASASELEAAARKRQSEATPELAKRCSAALDDAGRALREILS